jgi:hypothetical protein
MPNFEALIGLVGSDVDSISVQAFIDSERLLHSTEPDMNEGEPVRFYFSSRDGSFQFAYSNGRIDTLFLFIQPVDGGKPFDQVLVGGLSTSSTRADVRNRLGSPSRSGEPMTISTLGRCGAWDRFDSAELGMHFEYTEIGERIKLVTVMAIDSAP